MARTGWRLFAPLWRECKCAMALKAESHTNRAPRSHEHFVRTASWAGFGRWPMEAGSRLILFTTRASLCYLDHVYRADDILLFGRESSGVPNAVHAAADARLLVPMRDGLRSLNVATVAAMA